MFWIAGSKPTLAIKVDAHGSRETTKGESQTDCQKSQRHGTALSHEIMMEAVCQKKALTVINEDLGKGIPL
jgi:hypothetical protein